MSGCRGPVGKNDEVPRVHVRCLGEREPDSVEFIEHGIEEDGVSWVVLSGFDGDPVSLAYEAALSSSLDVGVCVTAESKIVVHHTQLPDDDPVFDVSGVTPTLARRLGSNAARLAKGTALKSVD